MALPVNRPLQEIALSAHLKDVTTSGAELCATYIPAPFRGRIERVYATLYATATGTASNITVTKRDAISGLTVTVSGLTMALATASGVAGQTFTASPAHPLGVPASISEGNSIGFISDGAGADATVPCHFTAVLRRI